MTIDEMKARKIELGLTNEMIAKASGIPLSTVQKVFGKVTRAPRKQTIDALEALLAGEGYPDRVKTVRGVAIPPGTPILRDPALRAGTGILREAAAPYGTAKKPAPHTIEDYYALPDDQRVELIDGVFYDMGAPALVHQKILTQLHLLFEECIAQHGRNCEVWISPCDVRLDRDDYTMVQPDLLVICGEYDLRAIRFEGAPDLVVEILSPSTRSRDIVLKLYKYQQAGVREYWIVDPKNQKVTAHCFEEEDYDPKSYDFGAKIPVGIAGGDCQIDFSRILEKIRSYYR